jgi:hypothetical protein
MQKSRWGHQLSLPIFRFTFIANHGYSLITSLPKSFGQAGMHSLREPKILSRRGDGGKAKIISVRHTVAPPGMAR